VGFGTFGQFLAQRMVKAGHEVRAACLGGLQQQRSMQRGGPFVGCGSLRPLLSTPPKPHIHTHAPTPRLLRR
jgi:hypothetical protein